MIQSNCTLCLRWTTKYSQLIMQKATMWLHTSQIKHLLLKLTNEFPVVVHLFNNRSQMTSKCGKNKKVEQKAQLRVSLMFLPHFVILCDLLQNSPTAQWTHIINNKSSHSSPYARQYSPSTPWFKIIVTSDKCISSCQALISPQSVDKSIMFYNL